MSWKLLPPPRHGSRPAITIDEIVQAASRIVEREGYDKLTMRKVAEELNIRAASLYWHMRDREELTDLLADAMLNGLEFTLADVEWQQELRSLAQQMRLHLLRKRDAGRVIAGRFVVGPNMLRHLEVLAGVFRRTGLDETDTAYALYAFIVYILGFAIYESSPLSASHAAGTERARALGEVRATLAGLPPNTHPNLVALAVPLTTADLDGRFQFGLDSMILGIDARRQGGRPSLSI
jgi:TetR/AcrR family transcriptional regulator, tetracycline repressor protein